MHYHHYHPLNCIVPPHMLKQIAANGNDAQKKMVQNTITTSSELRAERSKMAEYGKIFAASIYKAVVNPLP